MNIQPYSPRSRSRQHLRSTMHVFQVGMRTFQVATVLGEPPRVSAVVQVSSSTAQRTSKRRQVVEVVSRHHVAQSVNRMLRGWPGSTLIGASPETEDEPQTVFHLTEYGIGSASDPRGQKPLVQGNDLRHVDYRLSPQTCPAHRQGDIARRSSQFQVRCDGQNKNSLNSASIKVVRLNDQHRAAKSRLRPCGCAQFRPPDVSAFHYQSSAGREWN